MAAISVAIAALVWARPVLYGGERTVCTFAGDSANVRVPGDRDEIDPKYTAPACFGLPVVGTWCRVGLSLAEAGAAHAAADFASHRSPSGARRDCGCRDLDRPAGVLPSGERSNLHAIRLR